MGHFLKYTTEQMVYGSAREEPKKVARPTAMLPEPTSTPSPRASEAGNRIVDNMVRSFDSIRNARIVSQRSSYVPPEQGGDPFATP